MDLNKSHPEYNPTLELIAIMPHHGVAIEEEVARDLGITQMGVTPLIFDAKARFGITIIRQNGLASSGSSRRTLQLDMRHCEKALSLATDYMERVYG